MRQIILVQCCGYREESQLLVHRDQHTETG